VLSNSRPVYPIGVITGELAYPASEIISEEFERLSKAFWMVDATSVAMELGNSVLSNIIMIGALAKTGLLPLDRRAFKREINKSMSTDKCAINLKAFDAGYEMIK
jgi:indolepyruvate ferredoxin oxidoreductase, beta subunit